MNSLGLLDTSHTFCTSLRPSNSSSQSSFDSCSFFIPVQVIQSVSTHSLSSCPKSPQMNSINCLFVCFFLLSFFYIKKKEKKEKEKAMCHLSPEMSYLSLFLFLRIFFLSFFEASYLFFVFGVSYKSIFFFFFKESLHLLVS